MFNESEIEVANKTSRFTPAVGAKALVPLYVVLYADDIAQSSQAIRNSISILDFGAGKTAPHARELLQLGYCCIAHEFGNNSNIHYHDPFALTRKYEIVYASNVLNVQSSEAMLRKTIKQIADVVEANGVFFANYPLSPRKCTLQPDDVADILSEFFTTVYFEGGNASAPVWRCEK